MSDPTPGPQVQAAWPVNITDAAQVVNQMLIVEGPAGPTQKSDGGVYLVFGHLAPPLIGDEADMEAFVANGARLLVSPRGSYFVTRERLRDFYEAIGRHLENTEGRA